MADLCRSCGACCAALKIRFHQRETVAFGGSVPTDLTEPVAPGHRGMKGVVGVAKPRCIALEGTVGDWTRCTLYGHRPEACGDFQPSWKNNVGNDHCDMARQSHGLPVLTPEDWE